MSSFDKSFKEEASQKTNPIETPKIEVSTNGNEIDFGSIGKITFISEYVGTTTGSLHDDYYVYEWFVKETGEIFYVGKGRGNRYKKYHERAYEAEKIKRLFDTDVKFVAQKLTEEQALEVETKEMTRILNNTNYCLTNRVIPFFTKKDNGYSRSKTAPQFQFETAPVFYASEIDEHYFDIHHRPFDKVDYSCLSHPSFIDKSVSPDEIRIIYGGNYEKYYREVVAMLEQIGSKIVKTKSAKSVTAWIYPCDDCVTNYDIDEKNAKEKNGKFVPAYHLIDVWKTLKKKCGEVNIKKQDTVDVFPIHNRVSLSQIKNLNDSDKGFDAGHKYWEQGDDERKIGNLKEAICLFDKARYNGYFAPALYTSYAMAYRKLKDLDNEIAILDEAIERYRNEAGDNSQIIIEFENRRKRAYEILLKTRIGH